MATALITPDNDAIVAEVFVAAPPARVFAAITDPAQTAQWWGQKGMYRVTESKGDIRPGGKWSTRGVGDDGTEFTVEGEYLEIDPPRLLVHTPGTLVSRIFATPWFVGSSYLTMFTASTSKARTVLVPAPWSRFTTPVLPATSSSARATVMVGFASSAGCRHLSKTARPCRRAAS